MKILLINPQKISTKFDNKKTEIKKYIENFDFEQTNSEEINLLKRIALLVLNEEETALVTIDYKNNTIDYKNNLEFLIAAKILGKKEISIKVLSNENDFIEKYEGIEIEMNVSSGNEGFINWQEKNNINKFDWENIDFLKGRIQLSSFKDVMDELIKKNNKFHLSEEFIEYIELLINLNDKENFDYYFAKLDLSEIKSEKIVKLLKKDIEIHLSESYFSRVLSEKYIKEKDFIEIVKKEIITKDNLEKIFNSKNISKNFEYLPNNFKTDEHIIECITNNFRSNTYGYDNHKLNFDKVLKMIGKKYLMDKRNFTFFINSIREMPFRTNEYSDKLLKEISSQFDFNSKEDKGYFNFLYDQTFGDSEYKIIVGIIKLIIKENINKLDNKDKINLYSKGLYSLSKSEILELTQTEEDLEVLFKKQSKNNNEIIREKIKTTEDIRKYINKKENIISFIRIALNDNWLKSKIVPEEWKENNDILIETYSRGNYKDIPLEKRREIEQSKENVIKIIKMNEVNFNIIRNENKYDLQILKELAMNSPDNFKDIVKNIPKKKWFNFNFALKLIDYSPSSLDYIPAILFNNKQFTLSMFEKYEKNNGYQMKNLLSKVPEELKSFLQNNQITENYEEKLSKHFIKDYLEVSLKTKNITNKKSKI